MTRLPKFGETNVKEERFTTFQTQVAVAVAVAMVHILVLEEMKMMLTLACIVSLTMIVNLKKTNEQ